MKLVFNDAHNHGLCPDCLLQDYSVRDLDAPEEDRHVGYWCARCNDYSWMEPAYRDAVRAEIANRPELLAARLLV